MPGRSTLSRLIYLLAALIIFSGCAKVIPPEPIPMIIIACQTSKPPTIDGILDDPIWKVAHSTTDFSILSNPSRKATNQTVVSVAYDNDNLYLAYHCVEPNPDNFKITATGRDGPVWRDDDIELFIEPSVENTGLFLQFIVTPANVQFDTVYAFGSSSGWDAAFESQVQIGDDYWDVELKIPLADIGIDIQPQLGDVWRINFTRTVRTFSPHEFNTWSPNNGGSYLNPSAFGYILFAEDFSNLTAISGVTTRADGTTPYSNAKVAVQQKGITKLATLSDENGKYRFYLLPGDYTLKAWKGGHVASLEGISVKSGSREEDVNISLRSSGSISGEVLCKKEPIYRAIVEVLQNGETISERTTDEEGRYQIAYLNPGKYDVKCHAYGVEGETKKATITKGKDTGGVDFMIEGIQGITVIDKSKHYLGKDWPGSTMSSECRFSIPDIGTEQISLWFRHVGISWKYGDAVYLNDNLIPPLDYRPKRFVEIPLQPEDVLLGQDNVIRFTSPRPDYYQVWDIVLVEYAN